jgi:hypothetical protein
METRRTFLVALTLTGLSWGLVGESVLAQAKLHKPPKPTAEGEISPQDGPTLPNPEKKVLEDNDKDLKKKVDRLYELVTNLKEQMDKTDSSKVLNLDLMKKAEEIEKLARDIKNRSKG